MSSLVEHLKNLVYPVLINTNKNYEFSGTAFFINSNSLLTCYHVVKDSSSIYIKVDNENYPVKIDSYLKEKDIALLKVENNTFSNNSAVFINSDVKLGDTLHITGFFKDTLRGTIERDTVNYTIRDLNNGFIIASGDEIFKGLSGSPALNLNTYGVCGIQKARVGNQKEKARLIHLDKATLEELGLKEGRDYNREEEVKKWKELSDDFISFVKNKYINDEFFNSIDLILEDKKKPISDIFINLVILKEKEGETEKLKKLKEKLKIEVKKLKETKNILVKFKKFFWKILFKKENTEKSNIEKSEEQYTRQVYFNTYEEIFNKKKEPIKIEDIPNKSRKSLIFGKAGIGKTTLSKYIAYKWAKGEIFNDYDLVLYFPLRRLKENLYERDWDLTEQVIYYYKKLKTTGEDLEKLEVIKKNLKNKKILYIFDGYDELAENNKTDFKEQLENLNNDYIITTRPYGYTKWDFKDIEESFEIVGFSFENIDSYIERFFKDDVNEKRLIESLKGYLGKNLNVRHICTIPIMMEIVASIWKREFKDKEPLPTPMTIPELYERITEDMLKHGIRKSKDAYGKFKRELKIVKAKKKDIFEILGQIAFKFFKEQRIILIGKEIEEILDELEENGKIEDKLEIFELILLSGFLKSDTRGDYEFDNDYFFPHLTFQEYFSAYYVAGLKEEEIREIVKENKFKPHFQMFFIFLGGLLEKKGKEQILLDEIKNEPKDLVASYNEKLLNKVINELKSFYKFECELIELLDSLSYEEKFNLFVRILNDEHIKLENFKSQILSSIQKFLDLKWELSIHENENTLNEIDESLKYLILSIINSKYGDLSFGLLELIWQNLLYYNNDYNNNLIDFILDTILKNFKDKKLNIDIIYKFLDLIKNIPTTQGSINSYLEGDEYNLSNEHIYFKIRVLKELLKVWDGNFKLIREILLTADCFHNECDLILNKIKEKFPKYFLRFILDDLDKDKKILIFKWFFKENSISLYISTDKKLCILVDNKIYCSDRGLTEEEIKTLKEIFNST